MLTIIGVKPYLVPVVMMIHFFPKPQEDTESDENETSVEYARKGM